MTCTTDQQEKWVQAPLGPTCFLVIKFNLVCTSRTISWNKTEFTSSRYPTLSMFSVWFLNTHLMVLFLLDLKWHTLGNFSKIKNTFSSEKSNFCIERSHKNSFGRCIGLVRVAWSNTCHSRKLFSETKLQSFDSLCFCMRYPSCKIELFSSPKDFWDNMSARYY